MVRLGQILFPGIPLGPFGDVVLVFYASSSGQGKLHGDIACGRLRSAPVRVRELDLRSAVGKLCGHCTWLLPAEHPFVGFVDAVTEVTGLTTWTGTGGDHSDRAGRDRRSDTGEDGCAGDVVSVRRERGCRHWRRLQTYLLRGHASLIAYPWLGTWATPTVAALAAAVERERLELSVLLDSAALLEAACAAALPEPDFAGVGAFDGLGSGTRPVLGCAWALWQHAVVSGWGALEESRPEAVGVVHDAFGRRRQGRAEALATLDGLIAGWEATVRARAAREQIGPRRLVSVTVPRVTFNACTGVDDDDLSRWAAGAIAVHQAGEDWPAGRVDLLVPDVVARHLRVGADLATRLGDTGEPSGGLSGDEDEDECRPGGCGRMAPVRHSAS